MNTKLFQRYSTNKTKFDSFMASEYGLNIFKRQKTKKPHIF